MSVEIKLIAMRETSIWAADVPYLVARMAKEVGVYDYLCRPEKIGIKTAGELIMALRRRLDKLLADREWFREIKPENEWGKYDYLVRLVEHYLRACLANPGAFVQVSRPGLHKDLQISEQEKDKLLKEFQALRVEPQPGKDDPLYAKHSPNNEELEGFRRGWNAALDSIMPVLQENKWP